jgi:molybdate transport system substrate-binding protein
MRGVWSVPFSRRIALPLVVAFLAILAVLGVRVGGAAPVTRSRITVYAAASLTDVFPAIDPHERYSFGGSSTLATQIQQGAPADVFASANMKLPLQLHEQNRCSRPVAFTRNALVIVVPRSNPAHIHGVHGLTRPGVTIDIAQASVPVGAYTLRVLKNLNLTKAVMRNVVSRETDVREVLSKVALREVDAGFVYATDAKTVPGKVRVVKLPARAQPNVQYGICVVSTSGEKAAAHAFIKRVLGKAGQRKLHKYGFLARVKHRG